VTSVNRISGDVSISTGRGFDAQSGSIDIRTGTSIIPSDGVDVTSGEISITGGESDQYGGSVIIKGAFGGKSGGSVSIEAGHDNSDNVKGGQVRVVGTTSVYMGTIGSDNKIGNADASTDSGSITLQSGTNSLGSSGSIEISSGGVVYDQGQSKNLQSGDIAIYSGRGKSEFGSEVLIASGDNVGKSNGGDVVLLSEEGDVLINSLADIKDSTNRNMGTLFISSGDGEGVNSGGSLNVTGGNALGGIKSGGNVNLSGGDAVSGHSSGGDVSIQGGSSLSSSAASTVYGGRLQLIGGSSLSGSSGFLDIFSSDSHRLSNEIGRAHV
jgi:hypothetical protein